MSPHNVPITPNDIAATEAVIRPHVRETPLIPVDSTDFGLDCGTLALKLELLQHTGSFKARGAFANMLTRKVPPAGVVAASGGNHGAAVAFAAQRLGVPAAIFVPEIASPAKVERIRSYGANLSVIGKSYTEALGACEDHRIRTGAMAIHAYEQRETVLGQGTLGLEIDRQTRDIDTLLVAVGGGGLIAGIAAWFAGRIKIVPVESDGAPTLHAAIAAGRPVDAPVGGIAADSLAPRQIGGMAFAIVRQHVSQDVVLVRDEDIRNAQNALWSALRVVAEPGGAAAMAALLSGRYKPAKDERLAVLVCGANTTAVNFGALA